MARPVSTVCPSSPAAVRSGSMDCRLMNRAWTRQIVGRGARSQLQIEERIGRVVVLVQLHRDHIRADPRLGAQRK